MIAIDACVLSLLVYSKSGIPNDFKTGKPIEHARERVNGLVKKLEKEEASIVIPTPALSEALCVVAPDCQRHVDEIESQSCFKVRSFGTRAAIEIALRVRSAKDAGDKKEGMRNWDKIKYDRQIVAIAKVEGATTIYSTDEHIHQHGKLWGIEVLNVSDLPIPERQGDLFEPEQKQTGEPEAVPVATESAQGEAAPAVAVPAPVHGSSNGHTEGETPGETAEGNKEQSGEDQKLKGTDELQHPPAPSEA